MIAEARLVQLYPKAMGEKVTPEKRAESFEVLAKLKGKDLVGLHYTPLLPYFADREGAFRVVADPYVTSESGTGIVHQVRPTHMKSGCFKALQSKGEAADRKRGWDA